MRRGQDSVAPAMYFVYKLGTVPHGNGPFIENFDGVANSRQSKGEAMNRNVAIWIDHKKAIIIFASGDEVTTKTVESNVGPHARYSDRSDYPMPDAPEVGRGEKNYEGRYRELLHRYYDEVIRQIGQPETLLILGPAEAKLEFRKRLGRVKALSKLEVEVETTGKFTDAQLVAHVKQRFGPARRAGAPPADYRYQSGTM